MSKFIVNTPGGFFHGRDFYPNEGSTSMKNEFTELFDLLDSDIYTDAPEYSERVAKIKTLLPEVKYNVELLAEYLYEAHEEERESNHGGDGPEGCSYCEAIAEFRSKEKPGGEEHGDDE